MCGRIRAPKARACASCLATAPRACSQFRRASPTARGISGRRQAASSTSRTSISPRSPPPATKDGCRGTSQAPTSGTSPRGNDVKLVVTGGAGFIGSNFIRHVLTTHPDDSVVNFDKLTYAGNRATLGDLEGDRRYTFVHGDVCDGKLVRDSPRGVDA